MASYFRGTNRVPSKDEIFFVLTSKDVAMSGFCSSFCGYHGYYTYSESCWWSLSH